MATPTSGSVTTPIGPKLFAYLTAGLVEGGRFGALAYRDFRLLFFGQAVSAVGSWMQMVAQGWLVYNLTGSSAALGLVALARAVPTFLFSLVGGAVADRYDRRVIMVVANGSVGVLAFLLGILAWTNLIAVWQIVAIAFLMGTAFSFEVPCRQAMISSIVKPKDVTNAVGLNSVAFNTAAVIGPALAALLIARVDEGAVFMLNGATYLAVVAAAVAITPVPCASSGRSGLLANVVGGLRYVWRTQELLALLGLLFVTSLLARPYTQLLPLFARDVLQVGAGGLGALNAMAGAGAVVAGVLVALRGSYPRRGLVLALTSAAFGLALVVFAASATFAVSLGAATALGFFSAYSGITTNTMLQAYSDPRLRGRVLSLHGLTMMGIAPLGAMLEGGLGSLLSVPLVLMIGGAVTVVVALATVVLAPKLRSLS